MSQLATWQDVVGERISPHGFTRLIQSKLGNVWVLFLSHKDSESKSIPSLERPWTFRHLESGR